MPRGSKPGERRGGRAKGTPNRATIEREMRARAGLAAATQTGTMPLDIILTVAAGGEAAAAISDRQLAAAIAAAPFLHPRLSPVTVQPPMPPELEEERRRIRAALLQELADLARPEPLVIEHDGQGR